MASPGIQMIFKTGYHFHMTLAVGRTLKQTSQRVLCTLYVCSNISLSRGIIENNWANHLNSN